MERIDRTAPTVGFIGLPEGWQQQFPCRHRQRRGWKRPGLSGITSLKYKLVTEKGEYPTEGLQEAQVSGGKVDSETISGEGAVNG